ncbi:MAG: FAD-binding protein [Alphaproteobacteria bacterium]|nr:MAG: FAD-binding protein [Alphaproteobacteria bacterium]
MSRFAPADLEELRDAVGEALAVEEPLEVVAGGSKRGFGRPLQLPRLLDLSRLAGIRDYQPSELVLTAGAATPIEEIDAALAEAGQMLAFEPPDLGALFGLPEAVAGQRTLGGALACNLSGPRRIKAGAARDHFLGFRGVSGRGEVFKAGGKVVKNVTGYDLCKLMAGSFGTLAALEEVTVKVLPRPEALSTVMLWGLDALAAVRTLSRAVASPHDERLLAELGSDCEASSLDDQASIALWRAVRDVLPLAGFGDRAIWRVSVAPSRGGELAEAISRRLETNWYLDWAGGLLWAAIAGAEDGGATVIRDAIRGADGRGTGHATLIKGSPELRRSVPVFEPQSPPLAALTSRIKDGFDPRRILNPGRIVDGT